MARALSFDEAMRRFRDATGRPGPATWELGSFVDGHRRLPGRRDQLVRGDRLRASSSGKLLPTVHQFFIAANVDELFADILRLSNFEGKGHAAGESDALGPWGTLDMAGNVAEWCLERRRGIVDALHPRRRVGRAELSLHGTGRANPWDRSTRLRRAAGEEPRRDDRPGPVGRVHGDPKRGAGPEEQVDAYRRFYEYDRAPLDARVDSVDDSSPLWRKESVSFNAAYGDDRVPANLFLPKNASALPGGRRVSQRVRALRASSQLLDYSRFDFIMRGGRAALYPVYEGTYERVGRAPGPNSPRLVRADGQGPVPVDGLPRHAPGRSRHIGYYSLSMGAFFAPIPLALEPRLKAAVIASGGLRFNWPAEIQPANFAPLVKTPVLVNGRNDFQAPVASQQRLFELLGTPPAHKKHVSRRRARAERLPRGRARSARLVRQVSGAGEVAQVLGRCQVRLRCCYFARVAVNSPPSPMPPIVTVPAILSADSRRAGVGGRQLLPFVVHVELPGHGLAVDLPGDLKRSPIALARAAQVGVLLREGTGLRALVAGDERVDRPGAGDRCRLRLKGDGGGERERQDEPSGHGGILW